MKTHMVNGSGAVKIHVREWGSARGIPLLFIHGWSQSHLCWVRQYESDLQDEFRVVAIDLRGHGQSDAPLDAAEYTNGDRWADDIAAVIDQLSLDHPVLVGWSYGGYVICDYIRRYGDGRISGINFVAAAVVLGPKAFGELIGPGFLDHAPAACEADLATNISAIRNFLRTCLPRNISQEEFEVALAYNMIVRPQVRASLIQRELDFGNVLQKIATPVHITHSLTDTVVLPAMSNYVLKNCSTGTVSWLEDGGHAPFLEKPTEFNKTLATFAKAVRQ
jgi:pimeloyl-ACP methyl ester carboxylesterase